MIQITSLTNFADQQMTLQMPDNTAGFLEIYYRATIKRWFFDFSHVLFPGGIVQGCGLCQHPNLLRQFKNILDFGFACTTQSGVDPVSIDDFVNGNASLFILTAADVLSVEETIFT